MTPLTKALLSKCEFDFINAEQARLNHQGKHGYQQFTKGVSHENARLMPLILALAECVEAAEMSFVKSDALKGALERLKGVAWE